MHQGITPFWDNNYTPIASIMSPYTKKSVFSSLHILGNFLFKQVIWIQSALQYLPRVFIIYNVVCCVDVEFSVTSVIPLEESITGYSIRTLDYNIQIKGQLLQIYPHH